jgi:hypothetical protein
MVIVALCRRSVNPLTAHRWMMDPPPATVGLADKLTQERRREIFKDEGAVDQNRMMHTERTPR